MSSAAGARADTPVQTVIEMMKGIGKKEKYDDESGGAADGTDAVTPVQEAKGTLEMMNGMLEKGKKHCVQLSC